VGAQALDPLDLFDIRSELTDDEVMVKDTVGRFVDDRVIPLMREAFEKHEFPHHLIREVAELGLLGSSIDGYDCAGVPASTVSVTASFARNSSAAIAACAASYRCSRVSSCSRFMPTDPMSRSNAGCQQWHAAKQLAASDSPSRMAVPTRAT
jgi:alkylation response protein AidB-like acyl-CoA dehydrogenase